MLDILWDIVSPGLAVGLISIPVLGAAVWLGLYLQKDC